MRKCFHIDHFNSTESSGFFCSKIKIITRKINCNCPGYSGEIHWGKTLYEQRWVNTPCRCCGHSYNEHK
jgi:DNA-directed RNA polymerase beta' subunit